MSKTYRLSFEKGINVVGDKAILPDGFSTILDNVDLRSGTMKPFRAPEFQFPVGSTNTRSWSYRNRWFHSDNWRDYVGEFIGGIERVYASEEGKLASKFIGGTQAQLGTIIPTMAPNVSKSNTLTPGGLTAVISYGGGALVAGDRTYRISAKTADGVLAPCPPVMVTIPPSDPTHLSPMVTLGWGQVAGAVSYIIWEGTASAQLKLDEVPPSTLTYIDNGAKSASGDNAAQYLQLQSFEYAYTYKRNVNQVFDEGGLSGPSIPISAATGRYITRDPASDGFYSMLGLDGLPLLNSKTGSITNTSLVDYPPKVFTEAVGVASTALVIGTRYKIATVSGANYVSAGATDNNVGTFFQATLATAGGTGTVNQIRASYNGALLMTKINFANHGLVDGDYIQFMGFTDTNWNNRVYQIVVPILSSGGYDPHNFSVKNVLAPTDASPWPATFTGQPQKAKVTLVGGGTVSSDDLVYLLGAGTGQTVSGNYRATFIDATHFSIPLLASQTGGGAIALSAIQWIPSNNFYTKWLLYRNEQGIWNLVDEIDIWKTDYQDAKPFAALGGVPSSFYNENGITVDYQPAPLGLTNFETHYGMLFGIVGHSIRWTPPLTQDAWPEVLSVTMPYKPVALSSYGQGLIILCEDAIYRLDGNSPTGMSLSKTHAEDGCFAPHSVQKTDRGLLYLSKRGIMLFDGNTSVCLTDTRVKGDTLTAPSVLAVAYPFWWIPTIMTRNYADLAGEDGIRGDQYSFTMDNTLTIPGYNRDIKSFYHLGKYFLFYTGPNFTANTAFCIDLQLPGFPITTLGMKILDAHVNEVEQAFILCDNAPPTTTVIITSPL